MPDRGGGRVTTSGSMLYEGGVDYFRSQFCKPLLLADFVPTTDAPFRMTAKLGIVDDEYRSLRLQCTPGILRRRNGSRSAPPHCLIITAESNCALLIREQSIRLRPGTAVIIDGSCEFDLILERDSEQRCLVDWLHIAQSTSTLFPQIEASAMVNSEAITTYIRFHNDLTINGHGPDLAGVSQPPSFDHLIQIIREYLLRTALPMQHDSDSQFYEQIKLYINEQLRSQELSPHFIAQHFDISVRKLYALFERMGISLRETITGLRLEAARRDLESGTKKVATILLEHGFGNPSTFYRLYKKHFGQAPRSGRAKAAKGSER